MSFSIKQLTLKDLGITDDAARTAINEGTWPVPKGWKLVPEEMDENMFKAFVNAAPNPEKWLAPHARYQSAIKAAPIYKKEEEVTHE